MENVDLIVAKFLKKINIPVSVNYCQKLITSHPDFPSLLSVTEVLERLGIVHHTVKISKEEIGHIEMPYLLHCDYNGGELVPVYTNKDIEDQNEKIEYWTGIIMQVDHTELLNDQQHNKYYKDEKSRLNLKILLSILIVALVLGLNFFNFSFPALLLLITSFAGIAIGYILVSKDLGVLYKKVEQFCNTSTQANCDKILTSDGAKVFGIIRLSDLVIAYFITSIITISVAVTISQFYSPLFVILKIFSALSVGVIIYSVAYQRFIAKAWCKLCMLVNLVLATQVFLLFTFFKLSLSEFNLNALLFMSALFFAITFTVSIIKSYISANESAKQDIEQAYRIKHSGQTLVNLLNDETVIGFNFDNEIRIGKISAPIQLTMVSNLFCNPCKNQHAAVEELIAMYPDSVSAVFRFVLSGADNGVYPTSIQYLINYWLDQICGKANESDLTGKMMHTWFDLMSLEEFKSKMPLVNNSLLAQSESISAEHYKWVKDNHIRLTPTFFINGYKMPNNYTISDLKVMTPGLIDLMR